MKMRFRVLALAAISASALTPHTGSAIPFDQASATLAWSPGNPEAGRDVVFTVDAHDPDGLILSAVIDYGDGSPPDRLTTQRTLAKDAAACVFGDRFVGSRSHTFPKTGVFNVRLTVTSGSCPLTEALQSDSVVATYAVRVIRSAADEAPRVVGGDPAGSSLVR